MDIFAARPLVCFLLCVAVVCEAVAAVPRAMAWPPEYFDDVDIAASPVVVIGYWPNAKGKHPDSRPGKWSEENPTELVVTKVIHGDVTPGRWPLLKKGNISWDEDGGFLNSASSSLFVTGIDVAKPNLWFLRQSAGGDKLQRPALIAYSFRCIQEQNLLPLFEALRGSDRAVAIAPLLSSSDPEIVLGCLGFIAGYHSLWPNEDFDFNNSAHLRPFLPQYFPVVKQIAERRSGPCRSTALAICGEMARQKSIPLMRSLLADRDINVRVTAMSWLLRYGDEQSVGRIASASKAMLKQLGGGYVNEVNSFTNVTSPLSLLVESRRLEYMPTLIEYLDYKVNDPADTSGNMTVRDKLQAWIGFRFPPDRAASLSAWNRVKSIGDPAQRRKKLISMLGNWEHPLSAQAAFLRDAGGRYKRLRSTGDGVYGRSASYSESISPQEQGREEALLNIFVEIEVTITNRSRLPVTLATWPYGVDLKAADSGAMSGPGGPRPTRRFVTIQPGRSFRTQMGVPQVRGRMGEMVHLKLEYSTDGAPAGVYPWVGKLETGIILPRAMP